MATIAVIGTLDTKGREHAFLAEQIQRLGFSTLLIDVGLMGAEHVSADVTHLQVARIGGIDIDALLAGGDRGECVTAMAAAAPLAVMELHQAGKVDAIISLGGGGGTAIATAAMRCLPLGLPKLMVSTLASGNTAPYLGTSDITMMPSVVDVAGLNRISKMVFTRAAAAICAMSSSAVSSEDDERPLIAASMFGNTTECVEAAMPLLEKAGYEVLVFHSTGNGGRSMEALIESGAVSGVLDITTTEWADELVGGILSAGSTRLDAAAQAGVPAVVAPGCLDMVNFGTPESVPGKFRDRTFYHHNPQVTLMRTNVDESRQLGSILAAKLNAYTAPVTLLLPLRGLSVIGIAGQPFHDPAADSALFEAILEGVNPEVEVIKLDCAINQTEFAAACAGALLDNCSKSRS